MTPFPDTADTEARFIRAAQGMLARPDYLIPIPAAERQFRDHYYGLYSAALLEDLFFDALGNFLRQTEPGTQLMRPPTGQKGWDYAFASRPGSTHGDGASTRADRVTGPHWRR